MKANDTLAACASAMWNFLRYSQTILKYQTLKNVDIQVPGRSQGLLYKHLRPSLINSFINSLIHPLLKIFLWRRHMEIVKNVASSHKTNILEFFLYILSLDGHHNCCIGSKVTSILLNGWILPTVHQEGSASAAFAAIFFCIQLIAFTLCTSQEHFCNSSFLSMI